MLLRSELTPSKGSVFCSHRLKVATIITKKDMHTITTKQETRIVISAVVVAIAAAFFVIWQNPASVQGSVSVTDEYNSTTTGEATNFGVTITDSTEVFSGQGTFGSVVITGANTGVFNLYDATTTNINERAATKATSTILVTSFPASAGAGTYTFDRRVIDGLYVDLVGGIMPTTTITYRR